MSKRQLVLFGTVRDATASIAPRHRPRCRGRLSMHCACGWIGIVAGLGRHLAGAGVAGGCTCTAREGQFARYSQAVVRPGAVWLTVARRLR
jgi:hypothetical protein